MRIEISARVIFRPDGSRRACARCGEPATEVDHEIARSIGGDDSPSNTLPICRRCNAIKGAGPLSYPIEPAPMPAGIGMSERWRP